MDAGRSAKSKGGEPNLDLNNCYLFIRQISTFNSLESLRKQDKNQTSLKDKAKFELFSLIYQALQKDREVQNYNDLMIEDPRAGANDSQVNTSSGGQQSSVLAKKSKKKAKKEKAAAAAALAALDEPATIDISKSPAKV